MFQFEGFSLKRYVDVRLFVCKQIHCQPCNDCLGMIDVAKRILNQGFIKLKTAMTIFSPHVRNYKSSLARRKLLRMPLACIGVGKMEQGTYCMYLVEKQDKVNYSVFQTLLENASVKAGVKNVSISKKELTNLLYIAKTQSQRELLKYAVVKAAGLSNTKAKQMYGINEVKERNKKIEDAMEKAVSIRKSIKKIAHLKDKALLSSLGIDCCSDTESSSESESDDNSVNSNIQEKLFDSMKDRKTAVGATDDVIDTNILNCNDESVEVFDVVKALDVFKTCKFNWFELVTQLNSRSNMTDDLITDTLDELGHKLASGSLGLSEIDQKNAQQSHKAYLLSEACNNNSDTEDWIVSDSDESENEIWREGIINVLSASGKEMIKKRREALRRKAVRDAKRRVTEERFLKRRRSKKVSRILTQCPDIGKVIEKFVQDSGAGADAWRRTGVLTFDGNRKLKKKPTFKRIQQHLQENYNMSISYGSVVQLCVARNKRRRSAVRYKGVAKVIQKRSRKGFTFQKPKQLVKYVLALSKRVDCTRKTRLNILQIWKCFQKRTN